MGVDRVSSVKVGEFILHVDRDHRGNYRGKQAMSERYRGWHYHVEHPKLTQMYITRLIEEKLREMGAEKIEVKRVPIVVKEKFYPYRGELKKVVERKVYEKELYKWLRQHNIHYRIIKIDVKNRVVYWRRGSSLKRFSFPKKFVYVADEKFYRKIGGKWVEISREEYEKLYNHCEEVEKIVGWEFEPELFIGTVEATPSYVSYWRLGDKETILWISSRTGKLHIEANKNREYVKSILTKPILIKILKNISKEVKP